MHLRPGAIALGGLAIALAAGCASSGVVRVVDGRPVEGRFVSPRAYAYYARGASAEARGDLPDALRDYEAAVAEDEGADLWTRIGAVRCALLGAAGEGVIDAWRRAEVIDAAFEPLWRARARCELAAGHASSALVAAERALALDPEQVEASLVVADALAGVGRLEDARRLLGALLARSPTTTSAWRALRDLARRSGDAATLARATERLRTSAEHAPVVASERASERAAQVDRALVHGDLVTVRRLALAAHQPLAEVAVRAAALARPAAARELAETVLAADPHEGSALIALAAAADLEGDSAALDRALSAPLRSPPSPPSPLARLVLTELIARRVGPAPARAILDSTAPAPGEPDPLVDALASRLRVRLAPAG